MFDMKPHLLNNNTEELFWITLNLQIVSKLSVQPFLSNFWISFTTLHFIPRNLNKYQLPIQHDINVAKITADSIKVNGQHILETNQFEKSF